jgi:hypothetical protein
MSFNIRNAILIICFLSLQLLLKSQTNYPMSFCWVGECNGLSKFILQVHFEDFENMLDGKGSKINGQLYLINKPKKLKVEGFIQNDSMQIQSFPFIEDSVSFVFKQLQKTELLQIGKWKYKQKSGDLMLQTADMSQKSSSLLNGFAVALNLRNVQIKKDSIHYAGYNWLPQTLYLSIAEGYRLNEKISSKVKFYGFDFLKLANYHTNDPDSLSTQVHWQLLDADNTQPYFTEWVYLESKTQLISLSFKTWKLEGLQLKEIQVPYTDEILYKMSNSKGFPLQWGAISSNQFYLLDRSNQLHQWQWQKGKWVKL